MGSNPTLSAIAVPSAGLKPGPRPAQRQIARIIYAPTLSLLRRKVERWQKYVKVVPPNAAVPSDATADTPDTRTILGPLQPKRWVAGAQPVVLAQAARSVSAIKSRVIGTASRLIDSSN